MAKPADTGKGHNQGHTGKPEDTPGKGPEKPTQTDYRNYPRSPEPLQGPAPYPPEGPLPTVKGDPTPPVFPIGTEAKNLTDKPKGKGETDMERMEDAQPKVKTPDVCPTCRGRGFIGGKECPDCGGSGVKGHKKESVKE